jgi:plasmid stabilization system protein ParE
MSPTSSSITSKTSWNYWVALHYWGGRAKELQPEVRSFAVGNYVIFYIPRKDDITVVRVLSGFRDLDALF